MTRPLTTPSAKPTAERPLAEVNRQFMRLVLRQRGTLLYIDERRALFAQVAGLFPWLPDDQRQDVLVTLMRRWESGHLTGISFAYVRCIVGDLCKKEARERKRCPALDDATQVASNGVGPAVGCTIRDVGRRVRESLAGDDRMLFERWVASGNEHGWQRQVARDSGRSDGWVSTRLARLCDWMKEAHEIHDADLFVESLAAFETPQDEADEPPAQVSEARQKRGESETAPASAVERAKQLREAFAEGTRERQFMDDAVVLSAEELRACYPDEGELLDRLHRQYAGLEGDAPDVSSS